MSSDRFASQDKMSIDEILNMKSNGNDNKNQNKNFNSGGVRPEWMKLKNHNFSIEEEYLPKGYPSRPEPTQDITHEQAAMFLVKLNAFSAVDAMKVTNSNKIVKLTLGSQRAKADHQLWEKLVGKAYLSSTTSSNTLVPDETKRHYFEYVQQHIACNGTLGGLVWRIKNQIPNQASKLTIVRDYGGYILKHFVLDAFEHLRPPITEMPDFKDSSIFKLNPKATPGFPYLATNSAAKTDPGTVSNAIQLAKKYLALLTTDDNKLSKIGSYFLANPLEALLLLKRKNERMDAANYWLKVRPYFAYPLALKLLFLWTAHYLEEHLVPFWDDFNSNSAYKFSWFYGGCLRIVECMQKTKSLADSGKVPIFKAICFGDDQYWFFAFPNRAKIFVVAPDVAGMDMNCSPRSGFLMMLLLEKQWKLPHVFKKVLQMHMTSAFIGYFHLAGAFQLFKSWGLNSGVPGTTVIDIFNSILIHGLVDMEFQKDGPKLSVNSQSDEETLSNLTNWFKTSIAPRVNKELGFSFKEETLKFQGWSHGENLDLPFLGMRIEFDESANKYYPVPAEPEKLAATLVLPTASGKHISQPAYAMERCYGALLSGGWSDGFLSDVIRSTYNEYGSKGNKPANPGDLPFGFADAKEYFDYMSKQYSDSYPPLPDQKVIFDMFVLTKVEFVTKYMMGKEPESAKESDTTNNSRSARTPKTPQEGNYFKFDFDNMPNPFSNRVPTEEKHMGKYEKPRPKPINTKKKQEYRPKTTPHRRVGNETDYYVDEEEDENLFYENDHQFDDDDIDLRESERNVGGGPREYHEGGYFDDDGRDVEEKEMDLFIRNFKSGLHNSVVDTMD